MEVSSSVGGAIDVDRVRPSRGRRSVESVRPVFGPDDALLEQDVAVEAPLAGLDDGVGIADAVVEGEALHER